jgi:hypothetical protein
MGVITPLMMVVVLSWLLFFGPTKEALMVGQYIPSSGSFLLL